MGLKKKDLKERGHRKLRTKNNPVFHVILINSMQLNVWRGRERERERKREREREREIMLRLL